jgi:hypothetical protein
MDTAKVIAAVPCPACHVPAGQPCTRPTDTTRLTVAYVHLARKAAYTRTRQLATGNDFFLTFGVQYNSEVHPLWADCNAKGWVRITAPDYERAREIATERFGLYWSTLTPGWRFQRHYFPAGEQMVLP